MRLSGVYICLMKDCHLKCLFANGILKMWCKTWNTYIAFPSVFYLIGTQRRKVLPFCRTSIKPLNFLNSRNTSKCRIMTYVQVTLFLYLKGWWFDTINSTDLFFNFSHEAHTFRGSAMKYGPMQITDQDSHDNDVMCCCYRKNCREGDY